MYNIHIFLLTSFFSTVTLFSLEMKRASSFSASPRNFHKNNNHRLLSSYEPKMSVLTEDDNENPDNPEGVVPDGRLNLQTKHERQTNIQTSNKVLPDQMNIRPFPQIFIPKPEQGYHEPNPLPEIYEIQKDPLDISKNKNSINNLRKMTNTLTPLNVLPGCETCEDISAWLQPNLKLIIGERRCDNKLHMLKDDMRLRLNNFNDQPNGLISCLLSIYLNTNLKRLLPPLVSQLPHSIKLTNPSQLDIFQSCSRYSERTLAHSNYFPGRTLKNELYYPHYHNSVEQPLSAYLKMFNRGPSQLLSRQYHNWSRVDLIGLGKYSSQLHQLDNSWENIQMIAITKWLTIPCLIDLKGRIWGDWNTCYRVFNFHGIRVPNDLTNLTLNESISLEYDEAIILNTLTSYILPEFTDPKMVFTLVPIGTLARTTEIVETLLASKRGILLFTPLTGTLKITSDSVPFIILSGIIYIPWIWVKLLIPETSPDNMTKETSSGTTNPPIRLSNWAFVHLHTAALICKFPLPVELVVPISELLKYSKLSISWGHCRNLAVKTTINQLLTLPIIAQPQLTLSKNKSSQTDI